MLEASWLDWKHKFWLFLPSQLLQIAEEAQQETRELLTEITLWKVVRAIVALAIAYGAISASDLLVNWLSEWVPRQFRLIIKQSLPLARAFILLCAISFLLNLFLNLSDANLLAVTGTVAVALGFAFKDYVSSVIAGFIALFEVPYQVGDRIAIADHYGEVVSYGLRSIRLRTPSDNIVTIPHNKIWTDAVSNANKGALEAQIVTDFFFAHNVDIERVMRILYRVAQTSKYTQLKHPIVVIMEEKPWGTQFRLKAYPMDARDEFIYKTDLIRRAKQAFRKWEVEYPDVFGTWENSSPSG